MSDPSLDDDRREALVSQLVDARREVRASLKADSQPALSEARRRVEQAKIALGERGPVWWDDGAPDYNRKMVNSTPYAAWFLSLSGEGEP